MKVNGIVTEVQAFTPSEKNECIKIQGNQMFEEQIKNVGSIATRLLKREVSPADLVLRTNEHDHVVQFAGE